MGGVRAELVPGASFVLDALEFDRRMRSSRAVIAGEGKLDQQSLAGKAVSEVATRARQAGVPCFAVVGRNDLDSFGLRILDLQAVLEAGTLAELEARWARSRTANLGLVVGKVFDGIDEQLERWIASQPLFFVAALRWRQTDT